MRFWCKSSRPCHQITDSSDKGTRGDTRGTFGVGRRRGLLAQGGRRRRDTVPAAFHYLSKTQGDSRGLQGNGKGQQVPINSLPLLPWKVKLYVAFETLELAREFERYLKSGSGCAFAKRHFWS